MLLLRTRPALLETPFEVFDQGVFTPNDRFYVRRGTWRTFRRPSIRSRSASTLADMSNERFH